MRNFVLRLLSWRWRLTLRLRGGFAAGSGLAQSARRAKCATIRFGVFWFVLAFHFLHFTVALNCRFDFAQAVVFRGVQCERKVMDEEWLGSLALVYARCVQQGYGVYDVGSLCRSMASLQTS